MAVRDDEQAERMRIQLYRRMTPQERILVAAEMFEWGVRMVQDSIRHQYPHIAPEELRRQTRRRVLPRGLADQTEVTLARRGQ